MTAQVHDQAQGEAGNQGDMAKVHWETLRAVPKKKGTEYDKETRTRIKKGYNSDNVRQLMAECGGLNPFETLLIDPPSHNLADVQKHFM